MADITPTEANPKTPEQEERITSIDIPTARAVGSALEQIFPTQELNTILAKISTSATLNEEEKNSVGESLEAIEYIKRGFQRAKQIKTRQTSKGEGIILDLDFTPKEDEKLEELQSEKPQEGEIIPDETTSRELLGTLKHILNNRLTVILGYAELDNNPSLLKITNPIAERARVFSTPKNKTENRMKLKTDFQGVTTLTIVN